MIRNSRTFAGLALSAWLIASSLAGASDRSSGEILADYRAVAIPKSDPTKKDAQSVQAFREAMNRAETRKGELAFELLQVNPDHPKLPEMLRDRWINTMMNPATAAGTVVEIDRALPLFKDPKLASEARFMKAIATIHANLETPERALPVVDEFIRENPKDKRSILLLNGFASSVKDPEFRTKLTRRLIADYPDAPESKAALATLSLLEHVGKPLDLEFTDAIQGTTVSIKGLKGKVVVLDFWATWCGPCVAEMPKMKKLYAEFKDQGVEFIGVSLDAPKEEGGLDKLKAFVAKNDITWPQYYQGNGWESEFSQKMGINSIPQLFLIDAEGKLASIEARGQLSTLIPEYLAKAKAAKTAQ